MINYNYTSNKKIFEKLIQQRGYFQSLYHVQSQSYHNSIFKYCCYCKTNINQQENDLITKEITNEKSNNYSHSVIIKSWVVNLEDESFFRRLNFLMKKIEENIVLIENLWLEEIEISDNINDNLNNTFPFDQPLDKSGVKINPTSLCLFLSEYTESSYKTHFGLKTLKDSILDKWNILNDSLRKILVNKKQIYKWACKESREEFINLSINKDIIKDELNKNYSKNSDDLFDDEKFNVVFPFLIKSLIIEKTKHHYLELLSIFNNLLNTLKYFHSEGK